MSDIQWSRGTGNHGRKAIRAPMSLITLLLKLPEIVRIVASRVPNTMRYARNEVQLNFMEYVCMYVAVEGRPLDEAIPNVPNAIYKTIDLIE